MRQTKLRAKLGYCTPIGAAVPIAVVEAIDAETARLRRDRKLARMFPRRGPTRSDVIRGILIAWHRRNFR